MPYFLRRLILDFGGNAALIPAWNSKNWFQRVDRLGKAAILAAILKYGGESGIRSQQIRKAA
jgi:hypothetical protein